MSEAIKACVTVASLCALVCAGVVLYYWNDGGVGVAKASLVAAVVLSIGTLIVSILLVVASGKDHAKLSKSVTSLSVDVAKLNARLADLSKAVSDLSAAVSVIGAHSRVLAPSSSQH